MAINSVCAEPGCPNLCDPANGGLRGYCGQHQMAAVLDSLDSIESRIEDVARLVSKIATDD